MQATLPITLCDVSTLDGKVTYVTLASSAEAARRGLVTQEILGQLLDPARTADLFAPDNFARNPAFVAFMHEVIRRHGPTIPSLLGAAKAQAHGWVYIVDGRTPTPQSAVPPEDIIGGFEVKDGLIVPDTYQPNPNHRILSAHGFLRLDPALQAHLLEELAACV